ncbi:DJ-1 family protein [Candidatus Woesearchaeota archaeon]|nr:DJ-1 family protein [Candidatus Woesearchaeota archaeon]
MVVMRAFAVILVLFLLVSCSATKQAAPVNVKQDVEVDNVAKVLFVIAHENFQDRELLVPKHLIEAKHEVVIASTSTEKARGVLGAELVPDVTLEQALEKIEEFDAVVFIGGSGSKDLFNNPVAHKIAKNAKNVLGAICLAPVILANAGVLNGKKATVWDDGRGTQIRILEDKGVAVMDGPIVVDGKLVTANGPDVARQFGERILYLLE